MPELDRRVVLRVASGGTDSFAEATTNTSDYRQWAMLVQDGVTRSIDAGCSYGQAART